MSDFTPEVRNNAWWSDDSRRLVEGRGGEVAAEKWGVKPLDDLSNVEVVQMGSYWKVFVGRSANRDPIDAERDRLRTLGYPDAWTFLRQGTAGP